MPLERAWTALWRDETGRIGPETLYHEANASRGTIRLIPSAGRVDHLRTRVRFSR